MEKKVNGEEQKPNVMSSNEPLSTNQILSNTCKVKDIAVDTNGNLYVSYFFHINVFDENCEFLWKYDFQKELIGSRIVQISILRTNSIGLLVEDEKNNYTNKLYIYD